MEEELRAVFARHEHLAPPVEPVRVAIERATVRRRRRRLAVRAAGVVLLVLAVVLPGYGFRLVGRGEHVAEADLLMDRPGPARPLNVLVLGLDSGQQEAARADLVLIAHIPADRSQAYLLSVPRDLVATVPPDRTSGYPGGTEKLSAAFHHGSLRPGRPADPAGGARLVEATLGRLTGLTFDAVVTVRFTGLRAVTDQVGGVRMCLDRSVTSLHTGHRFPAGCQHLDGRNALDLLRQRRDLPGGVFDRDRHGREYLTALLAAGRSSGTLKDLGRLDRLLRVAGLAVDVRQGELADLLVAGVGIGADDVVGMAVPVIERADGTLRLAGPEAADVFRAYAEDRVAAWLVANPSAAD